MFTRPDLTDADIADALATGWGLRATAIQYAAVGYGSHHWHVSVGAERWFVTVDDLDSCRRSTTETNDEAAARLADALSVARSLKECGLEFVIAPIPTGTGNMLHPINEQFVVALYPYVDGEMHSWGAYPSRRDRLDVLDLVVRLHGAPAVAGARADDFAIPGRDALDLLLVEAVTDWGPGPFGAVAGELFARHREALCRVLRYYDALVVDVAGRPDRMVLTHGEPHRGNTITTPDGVVLIDWDTALLAPPERDLWSLLDEDATIGTDYTHRTGVDLDDAALQMYRLWWDLCEVSIYTAQFRIDHGDTQDTRIAWDGLQTYLDPARWPLNRSG